MSINDEDHLLLKHTDFIDGYFEDIEVKNLDNKPYQPPSPTFMYNEERELVCVSCNEKCINLKQFALHITTGCNSHLQDYGKILLYERLIIIYYI